MSAADYLEAIAIVLRHLDAPDILARDLDRIARVLRRSPKLDRRLYRLAFGGAS